MSRILSRNVLLALSLAATASAAVTSGASAFGGHFGGGPSMSFAHAGAGHFAGGPIGHAPMHLSPAVFHMPIHAPIHGPIYGPVHFPVHFPIHAPIHIPVHVPIHWPIGHLPPWHPLPPPVIIGHHPHWPIIVPVGGPVIPVGGPIVPVAEPVAVAQPVGYAAPAVAAPAAVSSLCGASGVFAAVTFVPTVTAADITTFLKTYNVTMADGPSADGVYRIRLSDRPIPQSRIDEVLASIRTQTAIVTTVVGV